MTRPPGSVIGPACEHEAGCITCGDQAVALVVERVDAPSGLAVCVGDAGKRELVDVALVGPVRDGDALLVHAGTALQRLDAEGRRTP